MSKLNEEIEKEKTKTKDLEGQIKKNLSSSNDVELKNSTTKNAEYRNLSSKHTLIGHMAKVYQVSWSGDSRRFVSCSQDGKLIVWNALTTHKIHAVPLKSQWVMACAFAPSGDLFASSGLDNMCSIFSLKTESKDPVIELVGHDGYVGGLKFLGSSQILTSSGDNTCILWDIEKGSKIQTFKDEHSADVMAIDINPDQSTFISGGVDKLIKVWDLKSGKCTSTLRSNDYVKDNGKKEDINSLSYVSNGLSFASGSEDGICRLFDIRANRELMTYPGTAPVSNVSFSKSGRYLFSTSDKKVNVWDSLKGKTVQTLSGHEDRVVSCQVSPDGSAVLTASWDRSIRVWAT